MDTKSMRYEVEKKYGKAFVKDKSDSQIQAIYLRLKSQGKI